MRRLVLIAFAALAVSVAVVLLLGGGAGATTSFVGSEWGRIPTSQRVVALTFDCGSNAAGVPKILATLDARHAAATFFLAGEWAQAYPVKARQIASSYPVGNHTNSHPYLTRLSDAAVRAEIRLGASVIRSVTGVVPKPLFRFPYGDRNARTLALAGSLGYGSVAWTVDTLGWKGRTAGGTQAIVSRVLSHLKPGEIVLMHVGAANDGSTLDADALPALLRAITARGYGFTTLTDYTGGDVRVVDDANAGRFTASSAWGRSSWSPQRYRSGYRYAKPANTADPARFKPHILVTGSYLVYARWPAASNYSRSAAFGITTAGGTHWAHVDQRRDGGRWVYLGRYRLFAGDRYLIQLSRHTTARGLLIADAVRVVALP